MVGHRCKTKNSANKYASHMRRRGYGVSVYKKKKGYGVSVTK